MLVMVHPVTLPIHSLSKRQRRQNMNNFLHRVRFCDPKRLGKPWKCDSGLVLSSQAGDQGSNNFEIFSGLTPYKIA